MTLAPTSSPLRVGFLIDRWDPRRGGAERALVTFAAWLEARGHEVFALGLEGPPSEVKTPGTFVPVKTRGFTRSRREVRLSNVLIERALEIGCDVTVGVRHLARVDLLWPHGGAHAATLRALDKPVRGRHHTFVELEWKALAGGGATRVVCVSELVRQELLEFYPTCAARLSVVPNGLDLSAFHVGVRTSARKALAACIGLDAATPILTFVGRNPKLKGLALLLDALATLQEREWSCVIAGPKDLAPWTSYVRRRFKHPERFHLASDINAVELAGGSDLLILPSRRETCGLVVLEALATGTPVLIGANVGAREVLTRPEQGEVLPADLDALVLAERIAFWLEPMAAAEPDRELIASAVQDRDVEPWMRAMERELYLASGASGAE